MKGKWLQDIQERTSGMSPQEKADHIWTYYWYHILGVGVEECEKIIKYPIKTNRRILVFGDSVSAGEVSEAVDYVGREDPPHNGEYSKTTAIRRIIWRRIMTANRRLCGEVTTKDF